MTKAEWGLFAGVAALVAAILAIATIRFGEKSRERGETERMRRAYVAWSLYLADAQNVPPQWLGQAVSYGAPDDFRSTMDRRPMQGPADPCVEKAPTVNLAPSDTYLVAHTGIRDAIAQLEKPSAILLASGWAGDVRLGPPVKFLGPMVRIRADGSATDGNAAGQLFAP